MAGRVRSVRIRNVASYVVEWKIAIDVPDFGPINVDVAYGGNYYAIVEPQGPYRGLDALTHSVSRREKIEPVHPLDPTIRGVSHVMWTDAPKGHGAHGRNAVFYGGRAIDRSPCGTGTSARLAHLHSKERLKVGDTFVHESYTPSPTRVTTLGQSRHGSAIDRSRALRSTRPWRQTGSRTSGGTERVGGYIHRRWLRANGRPFKLPWRHLLLGLDRR
jgi:proline racemase